MQHVWGLILALTTNLPSYSRNAIDGTWAESQLFCLLDFPVRELEGKTLALSVLGIWVRQLPELRKPSVCKWHLPLYRTESIRMIYLGFHCISCCPWSMC